MSRPQSRPGARWRRRKMARPGEIVAAALTCFAERGFAATRLDDVARRAGVTKGTLYLYFPTKAELFKAVVRQTIVPNIARGEALIDEERVSAPAALTRLVAAWAEVISTPASAIPKIVLAESGNFPDIARFYLEEVVHRGLNLFRRLLRAGVASGDFRPMDVENTVRSVVAPLILGMLWRHSFESHEKRPLDPAALCRAHVQVLARGLARDAAHSAAMEMGASDNAGAGRRPRVKRASP